MSSKKQMMPEEQVLDEKIGNESAEKTDELQHDLGLEAADDVHAYEKRIATLEAQLTELQQREREAVLRARAEIENIRRRTEQDIEKAHKFALERFSVGLLPIIDNLERALEVADKSNHTLLPMIEGVELTLKSFVDIAQKFGIESVPGVNTPFNPEWHEAMTMVESDEHAPNHVTMVMQKGYTLNGRLLRPAMVVVSKAKP